MSRVLILANDNSTIYNFRRELLQRLIAENYEVYISLPNNDRNIEFEKIGCTIDEIDLSRNGTNPIKELKLLISYKKQIKKINPDVVLTYTAKPNIYGSLACQMLKIPYINNVTGLGSTFQKESIIKRIMMFLQKRAYNKSSCVFFQNDENRQYFLKNRIVGENNRLIPGSGVNFEFHKFEEYPPDDLLIKFIIVSRVRQDKGFDEIFEAIKVITKNYTNTEFHIVGWYEDDRYKQLIDDITANYPVVYHGSQPQDKVHDLIKESHCLIHPSYHEGMANVLLESASCGRPCIASNISGCKETIDDNITGFLCDVKNASSLIESIEKFIRLTYEEKKQMGRLGRIKMEDNFDRNIVINAYLEEIRKVI